MAAQYPVIASNGFAHHMHAVALFKVFTRIYGTGLIPGSFYWREAITGVDAMSTAARSIRMRKLRPRYKLTRQSRR